MGPSCACGSAPPSLAGIVVSLQLPFLLFTLRLAHPHIGIRRLIAISAAGLFAMFVILARFSEIRKV